jgi:hypothetical protein
MLLTLTFSPPKASAIAARSVVVVTTDRGFPQRGAGGKDKKTNRKIHMLNHLIGAS